MSLFQARELIRQGVDPIEHRKATSAALVASQKRGMTFERAMEKYLVGKLADFDNEKHRKQWRSTLDRYAVPELGGLLVADIAVQDIQRVLEPIWLTKTETASRLRGRIEAVLAWAAVSGHRAGDNPARWRGNLDAVLPKPSKVAKVAHHPALSLADIALRICDLRGRSPSSKFLVQMLLSSQEPVTVNLQVLTSIQCRKVVGVAFLISRIVSRLPHPSPQLPENNTIWYMTHVSQPALQFV